MEAPTVLPVKAPPVVGLAAGVLSEPDRGALPVEAPPVLPVKAQPHRRLEGDALGPGGEGMAPAAAAEDSGTRSAVGKPAAGHWQP